jgi:hypothetical protein
LDLPFKLAGSIVVKTFVFMSKKTQYSDKESVKKEIIPEKSSIPGGKTDLRNILYPAIICLIFLIVNVYVYDSKIDLNGDNASYFRLGKALASGKGYINIADIRQSPENHFPPGYPSLISLVIRVFGESTNAIKIFDSLYILFSVILIYFITAVVTDNKTLAFTSGIILTLNAHMMLYASLMMSEASFILTSTLTLWLVMKVKNEKSIFTQPVIYISLVSLITSYYIRSTGLALLGGIILWFLLQKNWKAILFYITGFFLMALPWYLRGRGLGGSSYLKPLVMINPYRPDLGNATYADYVTRLTANVSRYIAREIPSSLFPFIKVDYTKPVSSGEWVFGLILTAIIIFGLLRLRKYRLLIFSYIIATFGILFLWPEVWTGVRFILPLIPVLLIGTFFGIMEFYSWMAKKIQMNINLSPWVFLFFVLIFFKPIGELHKKSADSYPANWKNYFEMAKWIKNNKTDSTVVCCRKADLFFIFSDSFTYTFPYTENDKEIIKSFQDNKVTHVVLDNLGYRQTYAYLLPAIQKNPEHFETILKLSDPDTYLLKFKP